MTVRAADAEPVDVVLVAEGDFLFDGNIDVGHIPRAVHRTGGKHDDDNDDESENDARPRNYLHARMKDLRHRRTECNERRALEESDSLIAAGNILMFEEKTKYSTGCSMLDQTHSARGAVHVREST